VVTDRSDSGISECCSVATEDSILSSTTTKLKQAAAILASDAVDDAGKSSSYSPSPSVTFQTPSSGGEERRVSATESTLSTVAEKRPKSVDWQFSQDSAISEDLEASKHANGQTRKISTDALMKSNHRDALVSSHSRV